MKYLKIFFFFLLIFSALNLVLADYIYASVKSNNSIRNTYDDHEEFEILYSPASLNAIEDSFKNFSPLSLEDTIDLDIISREEWGCPDNDPSSPTYCYGPDWVPFLNPITNIVIHHTAIEEQNEDWKKGVRDVWRFHSQDRGWQDIGYNYLIDPDGNIYEGRFGGEFVTAGHTYLHNVGTVGISMLGNYESRELSNEAKSSLNELLDYLMKRYKLDPNSIYRDYENSYSLGLTGHRDWTVTACPGANVYSELDDIRDNISISVESHLEEIFINDYCDQNNTTQINNYCVPYQVENGYVSLNGSPNSFFEYQENLYITTSNPNQIVKVSGNNTENMFTLDEDASSITVVEQNGILNYYTTHYSSGSVYQSRKANIGSIPITTTYLYAVVGEGANDILVGFDNKLYVANSKDASISVVNGVGDSEIFAEVDAYPISLAKDNKGNLYSANYLAHTISKINQEGEVENIETGGYLPIDIEFSEGDNRIYVLHEGSSNLISVDKNGNIDKVIELMPFPNAFKIAENFAFVTHSYSNQVSKINLATSEIEVIINVGDLPIGISIDEEMEEISVLGKNSRDISKIIMSYNDSELIETPIVKSPVYRFWSESLNKHFYTANEEDYNTVLSEFSDTWSFEKIAFYAIDQESITSADLDKATPVHRYWSNVLNSHFYTSSEQERQIIEENWPDIWDYEKEEYYVFEEEEEGTNPIFRFWSESFGSHFYANGITEKNIVEDLWGDVWSYEKIAYYVYPEL